VPEVVETPVNASQIFTATNLTGATLEAGRVVTIDHVTGGIIYADCSTDTHGESVLGILKDATLPGYDGEAIQAGQVELDSWDWPSGLDVLLLGNAGNLVSYSDLPAGALFVRQVASVLSSNRVAVDDEPAIYR